MNPNDVCSSKIRKMDRESADAIKMAADKTFGCGNSIIKLHDRTAARIDNPIEQELSRDTIVCECVCVCMLLNENHSNHCKSIGLFKQQAVTTEISGFWGTFFLGAHFGYWWFQLTRCQMILRSWRTSTKL